MRTWSYISKYVSSLDPMPPVYVSVPQRVLVKVLSGLFASQVSYFEIYLDKIRDLLDGTFSLSFQSLIIQAAWWQLLFILF